MPIVLTAIAEGWAFLTSTQGVILTTTIGGSMLFDSGRKFVKDTGLDKAAPFIGAYLAYRFIKSLDQK